MEAIDVQPDMPPEETVARARVALDQRAPIPRRLILTDVFGATPSNVAQRLVDGVQVASITGVNLPMLLRTLCYRDEPLDAWSLARAVTVGRRA